MNRLLQRFTWKLNEGSQQVSSLYSGSTVILAEGWTQGISACSAKWMQRWVDEPSSQSVIRGPKDGFTEDINTNIALLRRRIKSLNLCTILVSSCCAERRNSISCIL